MLEQLAKWFNELQDWFCILSLWAVLLFIPVVLLASKTNDWFTARRLQSGIDRG